MSSPNASPSRRDGSPPKFAKNKIIDDSSDIYQSAFSKFYDAARRFDKEKNSNLLKVCKILSIT